MAKIRKNLSDEDMLKGFSEELSFEMVFIPKKKLPKAKLR